MDTIPEHEPYQRIPVVQHLLILMAQLMQHVLDVRLDILDHAGSPLIMDDRNKPMSKPHGSAEEE